MKKIALLEKQEKIDRNKYDKVISFCRDDNENVDKYVTTAEMRKIYENVYNSLDIWMSKQIKDQVFRYRNIDILQAYGKRLFDFLFNVCQKGDVIEKIIREESPSELWISKDKGFNDERYPLLSFFIPIFLKEDVALKFFARNDQNLKKTLKTTEITKRVILSCAKFCVNIMNVMRNLTRKTSNEESVLIYSDLDKTPMFSEFPSDQNIIFLRKESPFRLMHKLSDPRINLRNFSDFKISRKEHLDIEKIAKIFLEKLKSIPETIEINERDLTVHLKRYIFTLWKKELIDVLNVVSQCYLLFERFSIKSLLVDEDRGVYKNLLVQISKQFSVKSYVNCHAETSHKNGFLPLVSDYIFVGGIRQRDILAKWGLDEGRIIVTGFSKYDKYPHDSIKYAREKICREFKFTGDKPIMLFASCSLRKGRNVLENTIWQEVRQGILAAAQTKNADLIIKLHPGDEDELYVRKLIEEQELVNVKMVQKYDPLILARGVDLIIVYSTTFCIDGLAYQKPVILTYKPDMETYGSLDIFYDGTSTKKLLDSINGIIGGAHNKHMENWRLAVDYCLHGMDGMASKKIANILAQNG